MINNKLLAQYNQINLSFRRAFVFRLGVDSGFFSEYNNMVLAILFCLKNRYRFTLSSKNSNFSSTGWSDFFLPFCPENEHSFHIKNNVRPHTAISKKRKKLIQGYRILTGNSLTQDFWGQFHSPHFEDEIFDIELLNIKGKTLEASKTIIDLTWNYNKQIKDEITCLIEGLNLPDEYLSLHVRRGDKIKEAPNVPISVYM